ncbi:MAG: acyl-CoA thioesterase [Candidatus Marinimicrobia bacterium]|nr:acyl-CoA thioesterase [Candidatus Neomarinimicrobiota bacterium]MCF7851427.1 acyl-CoA thioesterase [Candidatus Neomarinimicrobiota bacterium]MCF7904958.1 acyl-CoA thioesterase [Candidatus Neomarinimicrobiota bacterium]
MFQYDYRFKVRYKDIDQMGVMYYSRYFEYYESARTDMMRSLGLTYKSLEAQGIMMPVVHAESDYKAGPGFDDHLICRTEVREIHGGRMEIHYTIFNEHFPDKILNTGLTVHAFMKPDGKPTRHPSVLKNRLEQAGV